MSGYNTPNYTEQGGAKSVVGSGGELAVESGGAVNVAGTLNVTGTLKKDGVDVTGKQVFCHVDNVSVAEVNAGHDLIPAIAGKSIKVVAYYIKPLGGAAGGATALVIGDGASPVVAIVTANVEALTENADVGSFATVSNVTKGAGFMTALTAGQPVRASKTGSAMTTVVSFDIALWYVVE